MKNSAQRPAGSAITIPARGTSGTESDEDLCVVIDHPHRRPIEIGREIRREIRPIVHGPLDLLVYDSAVFRDRAAQPVSFEAEVEEEGEEMSPNITAELNADGELIGVEILEASKYIRDRILGVQ